MSALRLSLYVDVNSQLRRGLRPLLMREGSILLWNAIRAYA